MRRRVLLMLCFVIDLQVGCDSPTLCVGAACSPLAPQEDQLDVSRVTFRARSPPSGQVDAAPGISSCGARGLRDYGTLRMRLMIRFQKKVTQISSSRATFSF